MQDFGALLRANMKFSVFFWGDSIPFAEAAGEIKLVGKTQFTTNLTNRSWGIQQHLLGLKEHHILNVLPHGRADLPSEGGSQGGF